MQMRARAPTHTYVRTHADSIASNTATFDFINFICFRFYYEREREREKKENSGKTNSTFSIITILYNRGRC